MRTMTRKNEISRSDLHCHSTASQISKLGVQRALGLPECATPPEEVYELAKRRGMDFVTITDHDTIDGALEIAALYDDVFVSEELTVWFQNERRWCTCFATASSLPTTSGCRPTTTASRPAPSTCSTTRSPARSRTRSTPSRCRLSRATAAGWRSSSRSGRSATDRGRRSSITPRRPTSTRTVGPASAGPTTTPASTSGARGRRRRGRPPPASISRTSARAASRRLLSTGSTRLGRLGEHASFATLQSSRSGLMPRCPPDSPRSECRARCWTDRRVPGVDGRHVVVVLAQAVLSDRGGE